MMRSFLQRGRAQIRTFQSGPLPSWATVDPWAMSGASPQQGMNLVDGEWSAAAATKPMVPPGVPTSVALTVLSSTDLRVSFDPPVSTGGDAVVGYLIEQRRRVQIQNQRR